MHNIIHTTDQHLSHPSLIDCNSPLKVRLVFLGISKAFDKVWYEGLLYKLMSMGISGDLYNLRSYLSGRF